jgi:hypothetical protein
MYIKNLLFSPRAFLVIKATSSMLARCLTFLSCISSSQHLEPKWIFLEMALTMKRKRTGRYFTLRYVSTFLPMFSSFNVIFKTGVVGSLHFLKLFVLTIADLFNKKIRELALSVLTRCFQKYIFTLVPMCT